MMNSIKLTRQIIRKFPALPATSIRCQSTQSELILNSVDEKTGISTVTLNSLPVNSQNLELLTAFSKTLDDLNANKARGMILTSASPTVFSAGLDITEMYKPDVQRAREFWRTLQDCWLKLYGSSFPTAAAINGHAPAGGCLMAISCEYRVMLPNFTIGLNETKLGIVAPTWFQAAMRNTISMRNTEMALTLGTLFTTDEALKIGLIDEVAQDKTDLIQKCEKFLLKFKKIPPLARAYSKQAFRMKDIKALENNRDADIEIFIKTITAEKAQKAMGDYIASLKAKK